ncbi:MAG: precorrin-2 C(20)-methyltransferase [Syntrophomonadaceae bacterium]|jgi:precorrin-2/cobalt-factor-2 C20-methyltransferase
MNWGKLYGIGVGPGDPDLLTVKARRILEQIEVLFVPKSTMERRSVAYAIVSAALDKQWQCIDVLLPMIQDEALLNQHWRQGAAEVLKHLRTGRDGAFITLGDPTLYSTFTYLLKHIKNQAPEVPVEIIPGISAVNAISAALQQALAEGDENLLITPALLEQENLAQLVDQFDNIVLMKAGRQIDKICAVLKERGADKQARLVSRCGFADAVFSDDVFSIKGQDLDYLSTVIIKNKAGGASR